MKPIFFLIIYFLFVTVSSADDTVTSKEYFISKYRAILQYFTTLSNDDIEKDIENINITDKAIKGQYLDLGFKSKYIKDINFEMKLYRGVKDLAHLKSFGNVKPIFFIEKIHEILFNQKISDKDFYLKWMSIYENSSYPDGREYHFGYKHKNLKVRSGTDCIKISFDSKLHRFFYNGIPEFVDKKVILNKKKICKLGEEKFKEIVNKLKENYLFKTETKTVSFNNFVYTIPNSVFSTWWKEFETDTLPKHINYEESRAELCYEIEFLVKGSFKGGEPNAYLYKGFIPKIGNGLYMEFTYSFIFWFDPETGEFKGGNFVSNFPQEWKKNPDKFRTNIRKKQ